MISKESLDCGSFEIYDNYIISTINEGIVIDQACKDAIWQLCDTHFEGKTFGYISNRRNSYSIDPTIYLKADNRFSNLKVMAIVSQRALHRKNFEIERQFFSAKIDLFSTVDEAKQWITETLDYSKSKSLST